MERIPEHDILETIVDQFTALLRAGQLPAIADYQAQHPDLAEEIQEVLSSVAMIEQLKSSSSTRAERIQLLDTVSRLNQIGNYQIIREMGRGGMGIVFAAVHESLGRRVAIKVMPTPLVDGGKNVERFRREAQAAARLHHTNIVSVFGVGEEEGFHYYVMDLVEGECLTESIARWRQNPEREFDQEPRRNGSTNAEDRSQSPSSSWTSPVLNRFYRVAQIGASIADALSYAHAAEILHRDIKPSNILLDQKGTAWITDFGLAKDSSQTMNLTKTGDVMGTPQYLAPESLEGIYDRCSETYCLGLTLYEMATLQPAYDAGSPTEIIRAIATSSPTAARKINRNIPVDLATIIEKCLACEPRFRYQSAADLRNDLLAFLEDRPISARRPSLAENVTRWSKRNPLLATLTAISALLLVLVAISASIGYIATTAALTKEAEKSESLRQQQIATEDARQQAEQNLQQMKVQHHRAEANVAISMEVLDEMFKQVIARDARSTNELDIDGFREISGIETSLTQQDAAFLNRMVSFYQQIAHLNAENERLQSESAKAFRRVGNIYQLVGEMQPAIEAYEKSIELNQIFGHQWLDAKEHLLAMVQTQNELSAACRQNGDPVAAHSWNRESLQLLEDSPLSQQDPDVRLELARTLSVLGFNLFRVMSVSDLGALSKSDFENRRKQKAESGAAIGSYRESNRDLVAGNSKKPNANRRNSSAAVTDRWATIEFAAVMGGNRRSFERRNRLLTQRAIKIMDDLIAESPDNAEYRSVRATCYCVMAAANLESDRKNGFEMRDKAISAFEALVVNQPDNPEYRYLLALACALGGSDVQPDELQLLERASEISEQLIQQFPSLLDYHHLHASLKVKMAGYHLKQQQRELALQELQSAKLSIDELLAHTPSDRSFRRTMMSLISGLQRLEQVYNDGGKPRMASDINQLIRQIRNNMRDQSVGRDKNETVQGE